MSTSIGMGYYKKMLRHDPCCFCGKTMDVKRLRTVDHIHPTCMGGRNVWANLAGACNSCNSAKSSSSLLDYLMGHKYPVFDSQPIEADNRLPTRWYDPLQILDVRR